MFADTYTHNNRTLLFSKITGRVVTFIAVVIGWVLFRAESLDGAVNMYSSMIGYNGISLPGRAEAILGGFGNTLGFTYSGMFHNDVFGNPVSGILLLFFMLLVVWFAPNTLDWLKREKPALGLDVFSTPKKSYLEWKPNVINTIFIVIIAVIAIMFIQQESEFLYFQF
jgi:hypothetical protein